MVVEWKAWRLGMSRLTLLPYGLRGGWAVSLDWLEHATRLAVVLIVPQVRDVVMTVAWGLAPMSLMVVLAYDRIRPYAFSWADTFRRETGRMRQSRAGFPTHCPAPSSHHSVSIRLSTISICVYKKSVRSCESMISPRLLLVPMSLVLSAPHHSFRRPIHYHARPLYGSLHIDLALPWS